MLMQEDNCTVKNGWFPELKKIGMHLGTVFLCAGWYGTLATMLFESKKYI